MKPEKYELYKKYVKEKDFYEDYRGVNISGIILSFLANIIAICLSYFFIRYEVLGDTLTGQMPKWSMAAITIVFLVLFESLKRYLFNQTSKELLYSNTKRISLKEIVIIGLSLVIVSGSIYFTVKGAKDIANRTEVIEKQEEINIDSTRSKIDSVYIAKVRPYQKNRDLLLKNIETISKKMSETTNNWVYERDEMKRRGLQKELAAVNEKIEEYDSLKKDELAILVDDIKTDSKREKEENESHVWMFIGLSAFIEILILSGIFFKNYYRKQSLEDWENKMKREPIYKEWMVYEKMIRALYSGGSLKTGDTVPAANMFPVIFSNIDATNKQYGDFITRLEHIQAIQKEANKKTFMMDMEDARDKLRTSLLESPRL